MQRNSPNWIKKVEIKNANNMNNAFNEINLQTRHYQLQHQTGDYLFIFLVIYFLKKIKLESLFKI